MHIIFLEGGVSVANSSKCRRFITRTLGVAVIAAVIVPAYFISGGIYFHWVLGFGLLMAIIEYVTVVCASQYVPLRFDEYIVTILVLVELLASLLAASKLPLRLVGGCVLVCTATDISAYLAGTLLGGVLIKKRPFPKTSPNKSYEGLIFGIPLGVVAALVWTLLFKEMSSSFWRLALVAPLSVLGDLLESRFKRLYGVKDANDFIIDVPVLGWLEKPLGGRNGHGGYLDRLDSLALTLMVQLVISLSSSSF